jgi:RDD family protein
MLQRGYIILIVGAALLISGIIISALWAGSFAGTFMHQNTILSGISIRPAASVNASIQVIDISRPISLAINVKHNNNANPSITTTDDGGRGQAQIPNNTLREIVRNPNGIIMTSNEFTNQFFTTFKPDITGKYTITVYNLGNSPVSIGVLVGNLPFIGANNQVNFNSLIGIIAGALVVIAGIIILIGVIVLALDRQRITRKTQTISPSSYTAATTTAAETIVLASWVDFIIVSIGLDIIFAAISIPFWIAFPQWFYGSTYTNMASRNLEAPWSSYIISSFVFTTYWTYFELTTGQSIGKKLLHLRTTDLAGKSIDVKTAVIESFGKAFLLPLDVLLGWILTNDKRQRIFNRASNTIVIKLAAEEGSISTIYNNVKYMKD